VPVDEPGALVGAPPARCDLTATASALLNNVTTVLLIAPVIILLCQRLAYPVAPYLMAESVRSHMTAVEVDNDRREMTAMSASPSDPDGSDS
jgi:hypothetical protein